MRVEARGRLKAPFAYFPEVLGCEKIFQNFDCNIPALTFLHIRKFDFVISAYLLCYHTA